MGIFKKYNNLLNLGLFSLIINKFLNNYTVILIFKLMLYVVIKDKLTYQQFS